MLFRKIASYKSMAEEKSQDGNQVPIFQTQNQIHSHWGPQTWSQAWTCDPGPMMGTPSSTDHSARRKGGKHKLHPLPSLSHILPRKGCRVSLWISLPGLGNDSSLTGEGRRVSPLLPLLATCLEPLPMGYCAHWKHLQGDSLASKGRRSKSEINPLPSLPRYHASSLTRGKIALSLPLPSWSNGTFCAMMFMSWVPWWPGTEDWRMTFFRSVSAGPNHL